MSISRSILWFNSFCVLSIVIYLSVTEDSQSDTQDRTQNGIHLVIPQKTALLEDGGALEREIDSTNLKQELSSLRSEVRKIKNHLNQLSSALGDTRKLNVNEPSLETSADIVAIEQQEEELIRQANEKVTDYMTSVEDVYRTETKDSSWADTTSNRIDIALDHKDLLGMSVLSVDCKSSLCRLELEFDDPQTRSSFETEILSQLQDELPGMAVNHVEEDGEIVKSIYYLVRNGYELPQQS